MLRRLIDFYAVVPALCFLSSSTQDTGFAFNRWFEVAIVLFQDLPIRRKPSSEGFTAHLKWLAFPSADFVIHRADPPLCAACVPSPTDDKGLGTDNVAIAPVSLNTAPRVPCCATTGTNLAPSKIVAECNVGVVGAPRCFVRSKTPLLSTIPMERASDTRTGNRRAFNCFYNVELPPIVVKIMDTPDRG